MTEVRHPWWYLQQELLHRWRTQKDFAYLLGKKGSEVNELIKGKRNITVQWDILLSKLFDDPEKKWIHLQVEYDYQKARTSGEEQKIQELLVRKHTHGQSQTGWENQLPSEPQNIEKIIPPTEQDRKPILIEQDREENGWGWEAKKSVPSVDKQERPIESPDIHKKHEIFRNF